MPDYTQSKIYAIRSNNTDLVYIGSTTQDINKRFKAHLSGYNRWKKGTFQYMTSYRVLEFDDCFVKLIKKYSCSKVEELREAEGKIIRETKNCVNRCIAGRSKEEYFKTNRQKLNEWHRQHYRENKKEILEKQKTHYNDNKELYSQRNKKYREQNKEKIKERKKKYREQNKEKIYARRKEKVGCRACRKMIRKDCFKRHQKTINHLKTLKENDQ